MLSILLQYEPSFIETDADWIDILITKEANYKDSYGKNCFMKLLESRKLERLNFRCPRFLDFLNKQRY